MTSIIMHILPFCLLPGGVFLLVQGIKWIRRSVGGAVLLEIPMMQTEAEFTVTKEGRYAVWQKGRSLRRMAVNMPVPAIYHQHTGKNLRLAFPVAIVNSNDGSNGRIRVLTFYAPEGKYIYKLSANAAERDAWLEQVSAISKPDVSAYFLEIKESRPAGWLVVGILVTIFSAFCLVGALVWILNF